MNWRFGTDNEGELYIMIDISHSFERPLIDLMKSEASKYEAYLQIYWAMIRCSHKFN